MTFQPHRRAFLGGVAAAALAAGAHAAPSAPRPSRARVQPVTDDLWGERIVDPYRWMEDPKDPEWLPFVRGQTAHARATLDALPGRKPMLERVAAMSASM